MNLKNMHIKNRILLIPNLLSLLRIGLTPIICGCLLFNSTASRYIAFSCFVFACITDYLDGYIARECQQISKIGTILDPCADKLLTTAISCTFMYGNFCNFGAFLCLVLMILRDISITTLRSLTEHQHLQVSFLAKIKTTLYMISLGLIMIPGFTFGTIAHWALHVSCALNLFTGVVYLRKTLTTLN
jgi:CDP-diacylglycerol--glycerol-3-phosphate 3-phosphatidyltransferase